jgi:sugar/nucleoside kinase (ribokinase family)
MNTYLGACVSFTEADVDEALVADAAVTYLEGYLFDPPDAKAAFRKAAAVAHDAGRKVSLSLSDPFCVERHRAEFQDLVASHVDLLFANEAEATALFQTDFDGAVRQLRDLADVVVITRGAQGSLVVAGDTVHVQEAEPLTALVDTTGAGDLFAAGFLAGYTRGDDLASCARLGGLCAADVIGHIGARPSGALGDKVKHAT